MKSPQNFSMLPVVTKGALADKLNERQRNRLSPADKEKIVQIVSKALEEVKEL